MVRPNGCQALKAVTEDLREPNGPRNGGGEANGPRPRPLHHYLLSIFLAGSGAGLVLLPMLVCAAWYNGPYPVTGGELPPGVATMAPVGSDQNPAVQAPQDAHIQGKFLDARLEPQLAEYADGVSSREAISPALRRPRRPPHKMPQAN